VNIKERLDFSCAIFDANANLVANAPHMPVHLGSMDRSVETIARENAGAIRPGDVFALNAPYNGGTHLPDITVCTPVFDDAGARLLFWIASRGHHADVGGIAPGSMSPARAHHCRGGRLYRQLPARGEWRLPRGRGAGAVHKRAVAGAQSRPRTSLI
jgi:5-oxoprolinase (ATP-hydrolysing)